MTDKNKITSINNIKENLPIVLTNPIIKEFLDNEDNRNIFFLTLANTNLANIRKLDIQFKNFYRYNHIIRYLSGLIRRFPIDYDKRVKVRKSRFPLTVDQGVKNKDIESNITMKDLIPDTTQKGLEHNLTKNEFFTIENDKLYEAISELDQKQLKILYFYYEIGLNNREIAEIFGQTEQNISYWHKKTIKYLKEKLDYLN